LKSGKRYPAIAFLTSFAVYLLTLANTVSFFDSGELISAAATLGIAHPPGYPLYAQWGHLFSYLPLGNLAFRINLASAVFGSLAVMIIYLLTHHLILKAFPHITGNIKVKLTSLSAALAFAFSLNHWGQTNMSEVYAMNSFFIALIIITLLMWRRKVKEDTSLKNNNSKYLYFCAFLFGLAFGDHHTILVVVPVIFFIIVLTRWQLFLNVRLIPFLLFFFILGFSIYLYMPVRAAAVLIMNWGDPETLDQFRWMFLREGYPKGTLSREWGLFAEQLKTINLLYEFTIAGFVLFIIGLITCIKRGWPYAVITFTVLMVLSVGIIIYSNAPKANIFLYEAFHTPTYMLFAPWIGAGLFWLLSMVDRLLSRLSEDEEEKGYLLVLWIIFLAALPSYLLYNHFSKNDRSRNFIAFDYAVNELKSLSHNGILFTWGDSGAFPLWYLQFIEKYQDKALLLHTPHLASSWYVEEIPYLAKSRINRIPENRRTPGMVVEVIARENMGKRKSYIDYSSKYSYPVNNLEFAPYGIVYRQTDRKEPIDMTIWDKYVTRNLLSRNILIDLDIGKAIAIYGFCHYDNGYALLREGRRQEAINSLTKAIEIVPSLQGRAQRLLSPPRQQK